MHDDEKTIYADYNKYKYGDDEVPATTLLSCNQTDHSTSTLAVCCCHNHVTPSIVSSHSNSTINSSSSLSSISGGGVSPVLITRQQTTMSYVPEYYVHTRKRARERTIHNSSRLLFSVQTPGTN